MTPAPRPRRVAPGNGIPPGRPTHNRLEIHCFFKRKIIREKAFDWWSLHTGVEGSGKSTEAIWNCIYTDDSFLKDWKNRIAYTPEQFVAIVESLADKGVPGRSCLMDEAAESMYALDYSTAVQKAIVKLATGIRYAGIDAHLAGPRLSLISAGVMNRFRDLAVCTLERGFQRGNVTYYSSHIAAFSKFRNPYFNPSFYHRFFPLPKAFQDEYIRFKVAEAKLRLSDYAAIAGGRTPKKAKPEPEKPAEDMVGKVVEAVLKRPDILALRNRQDSISAEVLTSFFPDLSQGHARAASTRLRGHLPDVKTEAPTDD